MANKFPIADGTQWYSSAVSGVPEQDHRKQPLSPPSAAPSVASACVALYLAIVLGLFLAILHRNNDVFTYSLDDPYIHLALAQNLAHGHYGINPGEASSPSSSILWPFLLVPLACHAWNVYTPLAWNIFFCGLSAWLIGRTVDRWNTRWSWSRRFAIAASLMLIANLAGLTFIGMEHGLQILLAIACAAGLAESFAGRPIPAWCLCAAILGPMVRYENFALVAAVAIALYGQKRYRAAFLVTALSLVGPALFSLFLISRGLPALPSSVLVKAKVYAFHRGFLVTAIATVMRSVAWGIVEPSWWDQLLVAGLLCYLTLHEKLRTLRFLLAAAFFAALLQLIVGRFNWFHRYEVYAFVFTVTIAATALATTSRIRYRYLLLGLLALAWPYELAIWDTPIAAANVYQQQYQMHRFVAAFSGHTIAVNDLGLVSYDRPPGLYILDLWGLASPEASRQTDKNAAWLDTITRAHGATVVILYPDWYPEGAPDDWQALGTMCTASRKVSISRRCVAFYNTPLGDHVALQSELAAFTRTLPTTVQMTLGKDTTDEDDDP
jgi:hypothetical protein